MALPAAPVFQRISVLVSSVKESPGNVAVPVVGGRTRVLAVLPVAPPIATPLDVRTYVLPAIGVKAVPTPAGFVRQMLAVHALLAPCDIIVQRFVPARVAG